MVIFGFILLGFYLLIGICAALSMAAGGMDDLAPEDRRR